MDKLLNEKAATAQLSSGLAVLEKFIDKLTAGAENVRPEEFQRQIDAMHVELSSCEGLEIPEQHVKNVERGLELFSEGAILAETQANLGMVLASLPPKDDATHVDEEASVNASLWRDVEAWESKRCFSNSSHCTHNEK